MTRKFSTKAMAWSTIAYMIIGLLVILFGAIFLSQQFGQSTENTNNILNVNKYTTTTQYTVPFFSKETQHIPFSHLPTYSLSQLLGGHL